MSESESLSALVGDIYDAALDQALWPSVLEGCCKFVDGCGGNIFWHDAITAEGGAFHMWGEDPKYTQLYFEKFAKLNPLFPASTFLEPGVVYAASDIVPMSELVETRFFKEWVLPQGLFDALAANLERSATSAAMFAIRLRADQPADDDRRRRMALIVPHVRRAASIAQMFDKQQAQIEALTQSLASVAAGVFLLDAQGGIVFANGRGEAMLREDVLLRMSHGVFSAKDPKADRALQEALSAAHRGARPVAMGGIDLPLPKPSSDRWTAHVLPLTSGARRAAAREAAATAAVFVRRATIAMPSPIESFAATYRLSASELRVVSALVRVSGLNAMASDLGISLATVKTHLHNVFRKTGMRRQVDVVKLIASHTTVFES